MRKGVPETTMKRKYPNTYAYFKKFEGKRNKPKRGTLRGRSGYKKYFKSTDPFYSVYNVGAYSLSPFKVIWAGQVAPSLDVAVVSRTENNKAYLPDQTAYFIPFEEEAAAMYMCAIMNSVIVRAYYKFVAYKHTSMDFIKNIQVPQFQSENKTHKRLSNLSKSCHLELLNEDSDRITDLEREIDELVAGIWDISKNELSAIQEALTKS